MILEYIRWLNYSYSQIIADYRCIDWPINCLKSTTLRWDWPSMKPGARDGVPPCPRASWLSPWSSSHCLEHLVPRYVSQGGRNHCRKSLTISYNFLQYLTVSHGFCTSEVQMQYSHGYVWKWRIPPFLAISMSKTRQKHDHRIFGHSTVLLQYTLTRCQGTRLRARSKSLEDSWEFIVLSSWWLGSVGICWDLLGSVACRWCFQVADLHLSQCRLDLWFLCASWSARGTITKKIGSDNLESSMAKKKRNLRIVSYSRQNPYPGASTACIGSGPCPVVWLGRSLTSQ